MKLLSLFFLSLFLFSLATYVSADRYDRYPYYDLNARYLNRLDYGNITVPTCYDPTIRSNVLMNKPYEFAYCADNYYYRTENQKNPFVQWARAMVDYGRNGHYRRGIYCTQYRCY
jgi:hypothetical protein